MFPVIIIYKPPEDIVLPLYTVLGSELFTQTNLNAFDAGKASLSQETDKTPFI